VNNVEDAESRRLNAWQVGTVTCLDDLCENSQKVVPGNPESDVCAG
jgi:hypothetical protein